MTETLPLTLRTVVDGDVTIVHCSGRLTSTVTGLLHDEVKPLIPHAKKIVLDLTDLTFMDSMGLGTIASLYVSSKAAGRQFELINLSRRIRDLFSVTHLLSLFEACGETDARIV
jgi:anti-sigma B factor antagonist